MKRFEYYTVIDTSGRFWSKDIGATSVARLFTTKDLANTEKNMIKNSFGKSVEVTKVFLEAPTKERLGKD